MVQVAGKGAQGLEDRLRTELEGEQTYSAILLVQCKVIKILEGSNGPSLAILETDDFSCDDYLRLDLANLDWRGNKGDKVWVGGYPGKIERS